MGITIRRDKAGELLEISMTDDTAAFLKDTYDQLLKRYLKGCEFMNCENISIEKKEKQLPVLESILSDMSLTVILLIRAGYEVDEKNIFKDFAAPEIH